MKFEVLVSAWNGYGGGTHEEPKPSKELLRHLAGAEAAGSIKIVAATGEERKTLGRHVESQADSEKARAAAQKSGDWHEGNFKQVEADIAAGVREPVGAAVSLEEYVEARRGSSDETGAVTRG